VREGEMKTRTLKEIEEFVREQLPEDYSGQNELTGLSVEVEEVAGGHAGWDIHIQKMYEFVPLTLDFLFALSEFLGTRNINERRYDQQGCDTCDYGSSYTINLTVRG
jgi:hypothetical protein